jgi:hypothetical protein
MGKIHEDDPVVEILTDLSCAKRKITSEEIMEEETCHGEAMGSL